MWLVFAIISLFFYAVSDLFSKKCIDKGNNHTPFELLISVQMLSFCISILLFVFHLGESGQAPWQIIWNNPIILLNLLLFFLYWIPFLFSMRFIGLSINEALSSTSGIFYFLGIVAINLLSGKLTTVSEMFNPLRLIPIILVLIFTFLLPNIEVIKQRKIKSTLDNAKAERKKIIIGIFLLILSILFDSTDSIITTFIIDEKNIGTIDYIMASYFATVVPTSILFICYRKSSGKWFNPFKNLKNNSLYAIFALSSSALYIIASSFDAVRTGILFVVYPLVPIIGAKIFLKEKYTVLQNICIWTITISAIAFCILDGMV